jgi:tyrosine-protein kinase Etk/Wzc
MNQAQSNGHGLAGQADDEGFDLIGILIILAKYKKLIIRLPIIVAIFAAAISYVIPNSYNASAKLLPPQQPQSGAAALLSQLGGIAGTAAGAAGIKSPSDLYVGMLKSRTVADTLIAQFNLKKVYDTDFQETARKTLEENTSITAGKDGLITITVEDNNKKLVALIANSYVDQLTKLTKVLAVTEAAQRRMFFERQLEQAKDRLATAEMTLKGGLDTHGVISVDSQSGAIVATVGRLRAQISAREVQLNSMRAFVTTSNPEFKRIEEELNSARAELSKLENGSPNGPEQSNVKQAGLENIKVLRDVKYYQMLYELLAKQYEVARLDEAKDSSIIQVLDPAVEPERKFKPKRAIIVMLSAMAGLFVALFWVFISETKQRALELPGGEERWGQFRAILRRK